MPILSKPFAPQFALSLLVAAVLSACGGGSDAPVASAQSFVASITPDAPHSDRLRALAANGSGGGSSGAAAAGSISNDQLFQWAQIEYPTLFTGTPETLQIAYEGKNFDVRGYSSGNYLGVANGRAYGLGPFTNNELQDFGVVQDYASFVCSKVYCGNTGGPTGGGGGLNECIDPAVASLPTGFRSKLVYTYSGVIGGDQTIESLVDGPASFKGQNLIQTTATTSGSNTVSQSGLNITTTITTKVKSYNQAGSNGLVKLFGALIEARTSTALPSFPGLPPLPPTETVTTSETVYNPPGENIEYTLQIGQSLTKTETSTTTMLSGPVITAPITTTSTTNHTFEAKESVTVPAGTFNTCRYRVSDADGSSPSTMWLIVGKGIMAKSLTQTTQGAQTIQLKSGTYNGGAL
ncbi:MAG: hypothetical protein IPI03_06455 [Rubrivivax sp.]|nr:hypothetical protein [Rubrivivax sp.]